MKPTSTAIITCFHKYQPYGSEYYEPILDFFLSNLAKYKDEFDTLYILDSTWNIDQNKLPDWVKVIKIDPSLRYYDAYKQVLSEGLILEDFILMLDDDMVIYKKQVIKSIFNILRLSGTDVVSITDTIGTMEVPLKTGNKLCPYLFGVKKEVILRYLDVDWSPQMPYTETLGLLTEAMCKDHCVILELPDDKSGLLFDGTYQYPLHHIPTGQGYYHIRAGSAPALLLAYYHHDRSKFDEYVNSQPQSEYLRQFAWYYHMLIQTKNSEVEQSLLEVLEGLGISKNDWYTYYVGMVGYHELHSIFNR